ncbi:MAG TPA: enoyl-CoA hydratase-related protein [Candidatus Limnocylindrales bacterium]|nr:enoyl-CoA hydratase-related protein [Candidatus Limnocylindrales bacterium]
MSELVALELGRIAHLELANPPLNLFTEALVLQLRDALRAIEAAEDVRAVVVSGRGERAFSAGSHIGEFEDQAGEAGRERHQLDQDVWRQLAELPMPTIAAIEGHCLGGGLELALCCDIRVASETARLGLPEVRLAVIPGAGGTQRLPRVVGATRAKELILTGRVLSATEAGAIGLVNRVVPAGEAVTAADAIGAEIAARGPVAVREAKRLIDTALDRDIGTGLAAEFEASERIFATEDMVEGARAFFEKRDPDYTGR